MTLPASYSTIADVIGRYPPIGSVTVITSIHILNAIGAEQARIDGMLGTRFDVPFDPVPPVIQMICGDLAILRLVETRVLLVQQTTRQSQAATIWLEPWQQSKQLLADLAAGKFELTTASGTPQEPAAATGPLWSNSQTTTPAFLGQDWSLIGEDHPRWWP